MANQFNQAEINTAAWAACNNFRGNLDARSCRNYLLVMFLLKYVSDVWNDHKQQYSNLYGQNRARINRRLGRERFTIPVIEIIESKSGHVINKYNADFYSLFDCRYTTDIGEQVNRVLAAIEKANSRKLDGIFRDIDFCSQAQLGRLGERNRRIRQLIEDMNRPVFDMRPSKAPANVIGNISQFINQCLTYELEKKTDTNQISRAAASLVISLASPVAGETICDPVCGEGCLLIAAAERIENDNYALFGTELSASNSEIARLNMFMHGLDSARIEQCNPLTSPALLENNQLMKFDLVLGYLPSTSADWGLLETENDLYRRFWRGVLPKSKVEYAMICHMIESANNTHGRVLIVVPHGVLFRGGAEARIRQKLIEDNCLDAVIGLPCDLFPAAGLPVAALVFDRSREKGGINEARNDVLFVDANQKPVNINQPGETGTNQIQHIQDTVLNRRSINNYSYLASSEEIIRNKFNLNISRYVDASMREDEIALSQLQMNAKILEKNIAKTRAEIMKRFHKLLDAVDK